MTAQHFLGKLNSIRPINSQELNIEKYIDQKWEYSMSIEYKKEFEYELKNLNKYLSESIHIWNFIIDKEESDFSTHFIKMGFYPFGFYAQDYLFINLKTKRIEARDLVLTKYYDVAKDEQAFLEAFLIFAKCYAYSLENPLEQFDYYSSFLSTSIDERRRTLLNILKIAGGKKYRPFWVQVFQAWTDEELKEMGE